jgi:GT2 family glycosyltransferase
MPDSDVSVIVVSFNAQPWLERCLASVRGHETIVIDNGSTDGGAKLVRSHFPEARLVEQENVGMGAGNNAGMRIAGGHFFFLLNSDAWIEDGAIERLVAFAEARPDAAVVGPRLVNPDGTLQRSVRAFPTVWRLATEYLFLRKLAPRSRLLNPLYVGDFRHDEAREVDWVTGAALLVRRDAADAVGLFDEDFFMFSEEADWMYRFRQAGWTVWFDPDAQVVHVGGASHGGKLYVENLRGHLRFLAKHRGARDAERARRVLLAALRVRAVLFRGERRQAYREGARFLASADTRTLLS